MEGNGTVSVGDLLTKEEVEGPRSSASTEMGLTHWLPTIQQDQHVHASQGRS